MDALGDHHKLQVSGLFSIRGLGCPAHDVQADTGSSGPVYTSAVCTAYAIGESFAEAVSNYANAYVSAFLSGCKEGYETIPEEVEKNAKAVVSVRCGLASPASSTPSA